MSIKELNEIVDTVVKILAFKNAGKTSNTPAKEDRQEVLKEKILKIQLDEWRRKFDSLDQSYDKVRGRSVSLLTIQIAIVGYFLTQLGVLLKPELYGKVFFVIGATLVLVGTGCAIHNIRTKRHWLSPMYDLEIEKMNSAKDLSAAYSVLVNDYRDAYNSNLAVHEPAATRVNYSLFVFIAGAIMLVVLNFT